MEAGGKIEKEHANSVIVDRTQQFLKELGAAAPQALHTTFPLSKLSEKIQKKVELTVEQSAQEVLKDYIHQAESRLDLVLLELFKGSLYERIEYRCGVFKCRFINTEYVYGNANPLTEAFFDPTPSEEELKEIRPEKIRRIELYDATFKKIYPIPDYTLTAVDGKNPQMKKLLRDLLYREKGLTLYQFLNK